MALQISGAFEGRAGGGRGLIAKYDGTKTLNPLRLAGRVHSVYNWKTCAKILLLLASDAASKKRLNPPPCFQAALCLRTEDCRKCSRIKINFKG